MSSDQPPGAAADGAPGPSRLCDVILDPLQDPKVMSAVVGLIGVGLTKLVEELPWHEDPGPQTPGGEEHDQMAEALHPGDAVASWVHTETTRIELPEHEAHDDTHADSGHAAHDVSDDDVLL